MKVNIIGAKIKHFQATSSWVIGRNVAQILGILVIVRQGKFITVAMTKYTAAHIIWSPLEVATNSLNTMLHW